VKEVNIFWILWKRGNNMSIYYFNICKSLFISFLGGITFYFLQIPLAWILGPITFLLIYKSVFQKETAKSETLRNISFVILGIQIGSSFTSNTLVIVAPYFFPFLLLTAIFIGAVITSAYVLSKITKLDKMTSILGAIPGGLSVMVALSESFKSNTIYVTIFHSIRLLAVLFIIPFVATHFYSKTNSADGAINVVEQSGELWTIVFYILFYFIAFYLVKFVPASFVLVPMLGTAMMNAFGLPMYSLPIYVFILAQLILGMDLGYSVSMKKIKAAGKYCFFYVALNIGVIAFSFLLGYLFTLFTPMDLVTAMLSFAPGGLVEMAITAQEAGGDPSVVGSLQMIRLLLIVLLLPFVLQWLAPKLKGAKESTTYY
jgi:uncharacterized protein